MWLVLCHCSDLAAIWAYEGLKAMGLGPLELVSAESLTFSLRWEHRIQSTSTSLRIALADGREISGEKVSGALNRLQYVPIPHWQKASPQDQKYVEQEMTAFYASWLFSLPGAVLNPASPTGLSGTFRRPVEWTRLASLAGLPTPDYWSDCPPPPPSSKMLSVILVDGIASSDTPYPAACKKLAQIARTPLLGITFRALDGGDYCFHEATPAPDLRNGGINLLAALKTRFERGEQ